MNKLIITGLAIIILAGAFPTQAQALIALSSGILADITTIITPGQQTALLVIVGLFALAALTK